MGKCMFQVKNADECMTPQATRSRGGTHACYEKTGSHLQAVVTSMSTSCKQSWGPRPPQTHGSHAVTSQHTSQLAGCGRKAKEHRCEC